MVSVTQNGYTGGTLPLRHEAAFCAAPRKARRRAEARTGTRRTGQSRCAGPLVLVHRDDDRGMSEARRFAARRNGDARRCVIAVVARRA